MTQMSSRDFTWVRDEKGLSALAAALDDAPAHTLDLEANSGFAYDEFLCLMQWNVGGRLWVVDLVALREQDLGIEPLRPALEDPDRRTYIHGGEFDVGCLKRDYDLAVQGIWDSQQAASLLGWEKTGYGALVEKICGVSLPKEYAHYDWSRRPVPPEPLQYALDDVVYLPKVCEALEDHVAEADIVEEVALANQAVEEAEWTGGFEADAIWKVKGAGRLEKKDLPRLLALHRWRDEVARSQNRPPGRVLNNKALLALSRGLPRSEKELRRFGLRGRVLAQHGREILETVRRAEENPPAVPPPPESRRPTNQERNREQRLRKWRRKEAARRGVPEQLVLPTRALLHLKRHGSGSMDDAPQLGAKRIRVYGEALEKALAGDR